MDTSYPSHDNDADWLSEVLEEVNLQGFHSKLTKDLQLTKLSHFDFVSEEDLVQLGLSKPAAKRLLAAIKKRKSFVNSLKNRIVGKLLPNGAHSTSASGSRDKCTTRLQIMTTDTNNLGTDHISNKPNSEFGRLTCLINSQDIQIKEEIGNGVHGFVKKGEWTTPNGRVVEVALKILRKDVMSEPGASFNDFVKEISVMHQLNHPNIIKLYGVVLSSPMMMVTELAPFGNLRDKLRKENGRTPVSQLINIGVQIASGMAYLESKRFVHRDLAARNIFITHGKKILIGDLGLMRAVPTQDNHYVMSERTKIPYPWCAPESLKYKQFSCSSDVYMFGITLWEMFTFGKEPWAGLNISEILERISTQDKRLPCPEACPTMVYQTVLQCWSTEPTLRPNFSTLLQYLSTSYPLEVRSTQDISETGQRRVDGVLIPDDLSGDHVKSRQQVLSRDQNQSIPKAIVVERKVLDCRIDDRILVIDGQPEKYWWKGQNQRTFEIGWFPLSSTRWLAPKRGTNYVSKPLKNSFIHTGHAGLDGSCWGNPRFIDRMYLKNPLHPDDIGNLKTIKPSGLGSGENCRQSANSNHTIINQNNLGSALFFSKNKTKSKLSRLFGISESASHHSQLLNHAYQKFINEQPNQLSSSQADKLRNGTFKNSLTRSQSDELKSLDAKPKVAQAGSAKQTGDDGPPLIDFNDEAVVTGDNARNDSILYVTNTCPQQLNNHESLIDMDTTFPPIDHAPDQIDHGSDFMVSSQRRASDTRLDQLDENYHHSWAGSWNTGTFYGSSNNIYSNYYCPQDAGSVVTTSAVNPTANINPNQQCPPETTLTQTVNRYYSIVAQDE